MNAIAVFAIQNISSFIVSTLIVVWYAIPKLRQKALAEALTPLLLFHALRTIGLTYLVPAVADPNLPREFALPTAYGDLIAATLAIVSLLALRYLSKPPSASLAILLVWLFNILGLVDLLTALSLGVRYQILRYQLSFMWLIPAFIVPALIVTHLAIFWMLWKHQRGEWG